MSTPNVIMTTTAEEHAGFPMILWRAVHDVLGSPARPGYVVFQCVLSPAGSTFRADVHVSPCPWGTKQPYLIQGKVMPTLDQAIQVAAWETIVRLRHSESAMAKSRAFRFFPGRPSEGAELYQNIPASEGDPATPNLVAYASAMTLLNNSLIGEIAKMRRDLSRTRMQLYINKNLTKPSIAQVQPTGLDPGPSQPSMEMDQPQFSLQVQDALEPGIEASIAEALARVQQRIQERGLVLAGVPVNPSPEEVGGVDTVLRLSLTPPDASHRQAE